MSKIARWSYKSVAVVRPFIAMDGMSGESVYGAPYEILCNYIADAKQERDGKGADFISAYLIYTEDSRPQYLDLILLDEPEIDEQEIRARTVYDMKLFNDTNDYKLVT